MKVDPLKHVALALVIFVSVISCNSPSNVAEGGIGGSGVSMGSVSAIGSIWVNGVEYDTTGAIIYLDGDEVIDSSGTAGGSVLLPGMVVTVEGSNINGVKGRAVTVTYEDNLEGPIEGVPTSNTILVMGQTVIVGKQTRLKGVTGIGALAIDNVIEVSGFRDETGNIRATYVEKKSESFVNGATGIGLKGIISAVDSEAQTIMLGSLVVDFTQATMTGFSGVPAVNDFVGVKGYSFDGNRALVATVVERKSLALDTRDQDIAEMEGIVTSSGVAIGEFVLSGQAVSFDESTVFKGALPTDIVPGVKLEVEGRLQNGVVIAEEITFEDSIEIVANILSFQNDTLTLETVDLTVRHDANTEFDGITGPAEFSQGQHVEIVAREVDNGLLAKRLKVSPPDSTGETPLLLYGPVDFVDTTSGTVTVLGVIGGPFNEFEIESLATKPGADTFFGIVKENDLVEMIGISAGGQPYWDSIELDD